ncbi:Protein kinase domain [Carpediemonas membranifera]|uniref:non-specific serine/threonine protein kinase n=1 Tax=Carpediemonas membranifera TaxID=201153 RepID=A0A8J6B818_9EUKA|nr:Protein kinase domain [Carpediemonas membranifera]|eukprot:KAG9391947.1 Protein kinase domain [Carpediemonas membranifera]
MGMSGGSVKIRDLIGEGTFANVYSATYDTPGGQKKKVAMKSVSKRMLIQQDRIADAFTEKTVLQIVSSDRTIALYATFSDEDNIYFVIELCVCDLFQLMKHMGKLPLDWVRIITIQLIEALMVLREKSVIHRDLKPENVFISKEGYIKLADFACAKVCDPSFDMPHTTPPESRKGTFVGTAQYVAPEILEDLEQTYAADLWSVGCIVFQLLTGKRPFQEPSEYLLFESICSGKFSFPRNWTYGEDAKDFIRRILVVKPAERLGATDLQELFDHPFIRDTTPGPIPVKMDELEAAVDGMRRDMFADSWEPLMSSADITSMSSSLNSVSPLHESSSSRRVFTVPSTPVSRPAPIPDYPASTPLVVKNARVSDRVAKANGRVSAFKPFLFSKESIIMIGEVLKRKNLKPYRRRTLILTDYPRLLYFDASKDQPVQKGEIPWTRSLEAKMRSDKRRFTIAVPARTYVFKSVDNEADVWVGAIQAALDDS